MIKKWATTSSTHGGKVNRFSKLLQTCQTVHTDSLQLCAAVTTEQTEAPVALLIGDANGDGAITINDVTMIQRHVAEIETITGTCLLNADTNGDGEVTIDDATLLQRYLAEFDVTLGVQA